MTAELIHGCCIEQMAAMKAAGRTVDAIVTDPPYGLNFMGKHWDAPENVAFRPETWRLAFDLLKPGGHVAVFGGSRTHHRVMVALEDAGFEIRDTLFWIYSQGFPKSLDVSKAIDKMAGAEREVIGRRPDANKLSFGGKHAGWDRPWMQDEEAMERCRSITAPATQEAQQWAGWGTALKPAYEPIILARKPLDGTVAANVLKHGVGAMNIDACRVASGADYHDLDVKQGGNRSMAFGMAERQFQPASGRFPPNILHSGDDEVLAAFATFGEKRSRSGGTGGGEPGMWAGKKRADYVCHNDAETSAARFFPSLPYSDEELRFHYAAKASKRERGGSKHPTIKPLSVCRWLCRLICPPGGTILDPFCGSGSTLRAALDEGFHAVGIERESEYITDARMRLGLELEAAD